MFEEQRMKVIIDKQLCRNCVISTCHKAHECDLKLSCGMKLRNYGRCSQKHHATIHFACDRRKYGGYLKRKFHTSSNTDNAQQAINNAVAQNNDSQPQVNNPAPQNDANLPQPNVIQLQQQQAASAIQSANAQPQNVNVQMNASTSRAPTPRDYNVTPNSVSTIQIQHIDNEMSRTVKMFKNKFIAPKGTVTAYSVGNSASEVTFVRNDIRVALGIEGTPEPLIVTWTDMTVRQYAAIKFDMILQGTLSHSEPIVLRNCYAIEELNLPARTLDMNKMKTLFPYLKDVNFESYFNEQPVMLIGSPHAYAIESIKVLIEGGSGNPVALETKLGVTVYGGDSFERYSSSSDKVITGTDSKDSIGIVMTTGEAINEKLPDKLANDKSEYSVVINATSQQLRRKLYPTITSTKRRNKTSKSRTKWMIGRRKKLKGRQQSSFPPIKVPNRITNPIDNTSHSNRPNPHSSPTNDQSNTKMSPTQYKRENPEVNENGMSTVKLIIDQSSPPEDVTV